MREKFLPIFLETNFFTASQLRPIPPEKPTTWRLKLKLHAAEADGVHWFFPF